MATSFEMPRGGISRGLERPGARPPPRRADPFGRWGIPLAGDIALPAAEATATEVCGHGGWGVLHPRAHPAREPAPFCRSPPNPSWAIRGS